MNVHALSTVLQSFSSAQPSVPSHDDSAASPADNGSLNAPQAAVSSVADPEEIARAIETVKQAISGISDMARNLQFSVDEETGHTVVKVVDPETQQVIQQIPTERVLEIAKSLATSTGLLVQQKA